MIRTAYIHRLSSGKFRVISEQGCSMGTYSSRDKAMMHLKKVAEDHESIDLSDIDELSYSAVMRKLRASGNEELFVLFRLLFKSVFDSVFPTLKDKSEKKALQTTLALLAKRYQFDVDVSQADVGESEPAIPRFAKVTDQLYRGGAPATPDDLEYLKKLGIKKVVSLDIGVAKNIAPLLNKLGIKNVIIPIMAKKQQSLRSLTKINLKDLLEQRGPTFVHCLHGKDRTGLVVALYRVMNGMSPEDAIAEADQFDFCSGLPKKIRVLYEKMIRAMADQDSNKSFDMLWPDAVADYKFDTSYELNDPSFGVRLYEAAEVNPYGAGDPSYGSHWDYVNEQYPTRDGGQGTPDGSVGGRDRDGNPIIPKPVPIGISPNDNKMPQMGQLDEINTNGLGPAQYSGGFV